MTAPSKAPSQHLYSEKYHDRDPLDISCTAAQSRSGSRCDELATIKVTTNEHGPVVPQREGSKPWLSILIILVSVSFSFIFLFQVHPASPSCFRGFLIPLFSDVEAQVGRLGRDTTFPTPTSPAFSSNGRTDQVQWDNYTLVLRGQRALI
jgi:hypothetical protein